MAGQVKHAKIFSSIRPDWRLVKLLASLPQKNTDALIGGVARVLADEGIHLADSTALLKPLLAAEGPLTRRKPTKDELADIALRPPHRQRPGRLRHRPERRHLRARLRRPGGHGRHRRHAPPRRRPGQRPPPDAGESPAAAAPICCSTSPSPAPPPSPPWSRPGPPPWPSTPAAPCSSTATKCSRKPTPRSWPSSAANPKSEAPQTPVRLPNRADLDSHVERCPLSIGSDDREPQQSARGQAGPVSQTQPER